MTRIIEFKIPTKTGIRSARGIPIWLIVGERKIKFVLQRNDENKTQWLTHFASGYKFGALNDAAVELMCKLTPYHRFRQKQLAEFLIAKAIADMGVEKVLASIDEAAIINGIKE